MSRPPVPAVLPGCPSKIVAVHLSYRSRAAERGRVPVNPSYFLKASSTLSGHDAPVQRPRGCSLLAYEGEIALVIGRVTRNVSPEAAWEHVGWVTAANDFGVYDLRYADPGSNVHSKGFDGFTPVGPRLVAAADVDPSALRLRTWVNGELVQQARVGADFLFGMGFVVADLARMMTLYPGDLVLTGTPTGSSVVEPGDVVEVEVDGDGGVSSGRLRNAITESDNSLPEWGPMPVVDEATVQAAYGSRRFAQTAHRPEG